MKQKIIKHFELHQPYRFEITDLVALIYVIATICAVFEISTTPFFITGSIISTATCWQGKRFNLIILNLSLLIFNLIMIF